MHLNRMNPEVATAIMLMICAVILACTESKHSGGSSQRNGFEQSSPPSTSPSPTAPQVVSPRPSNSVPPPPLPSGQPLPSLDPSGSPMEEYVITIRSLHMQDPKGATNCASLRIAGKSIPALCNRGPTSTTINVSAYAPPTCNIIGIDTTFNGTPSFTTSNRSHMNQFRFTLSPGKLLLNFEDLPLHNSDRDFNDLVLEFTFNHELKIGIENHAAIKCD